MGLGWVGGGLVSSLTGQRPLWVGSNQPRKRVDVLGMRKKVEMGETGCKFKLGGVKMKLASSPVPSWGPRTHHVPPQVPRKSPITLF